MNNNELDFYYLWQKFSFQILHKSIMWILLVLFLTAGATGYLSRILAKHNAREKEAKLAHQTTLGYLLSAFALWLLSLIR